MQCLGYIGVTNLLGLTTTDKYPAYRDDFMTCYRCLLDRGLAPEKIFFGGDSAGGKVWTDISFTQRCSNIC